MIFIFHSLFCKEYQRPQPDIAQHTIHNRKHCSTDPQKPQLPVQNLARKTRRIFAPGGRIKKKPTAISYGGPLVDDTGLEPVTLRTSSGCSYQLS